MRERPGPDEQNDLDGLNTYEMKGKIVEILKEEMVFESDKTTFGAHYGGNDCPVVKDARAKLAARIDALYTTEISEGEIEAKFHSEYATPKDENYAIEYDAYMAGYKAALSKSAKGVRVVTRCKCPMCGEKFSPSDHAIHTERT